nr:MAG TPA_asm: hypothetical protein [Caudoviricetes sp.]
MDDLLIRECKFSLIKLILQQPSGCTTGEMFVHSKRLLSYYYIDVFKLSQ